MFSKLKHFAIVTVLALCAARVSTQLVPGYYLIFPNTEVTSVLMGAVVDADEDGTPTPVVGLPLPRVCPSLSSECGCGLTTSRSRTPGFHGSSSPSLQATTTRRTTCTIATRSVSQTEPPCLSILVWMPRDRGTRRCGDWMPQTTRGPSSTSLPSAAFTALGR